MFVCKLERQQCCWLRGHQQQQWEQWQKQLLLLVLCSSSAIQDSKTLDPLCVWAAICTRPVALIEQDNRGFGVDLRRT